MMTPLLTSSLKPPPTGAAGSKTGQFVDTATTTLEAAFKILQLLTVVTANVPYLNAITGCIQKLIEVQRVLSDNKKRADDLLNNVGVVSCAVSQGLCDLDERRRSIAVKGLHEDLQRYETVLIDTYGILRDWMSKGFVKRLWAHGDFAGIADGIDRRINAFRDAFSVARLIQLSTGQDALDTKIQTLIDQNTRTKLENWLKPANVAVSQRDAANKRHIRTGMWLLKRTEFRDWIYAPNSLFWLEGISGSGKTVLSSTIIDTLRGRAEPLAFFYFDTNNLGQRTVTQLLVSLVTQLSVQVNSPDTILHTLWSTYARGQHLPSNSALLSDALIPILKEFTEPVYIVVDALDECSERNMLLDYITKIVDAKLSNVHLFLTSRPEVPRSTDIDIFRLCTSVSLEGCVDEDLESYVTEMLSKMTSGWSHGRKDQIKWGLLERGRGMFRLVSLQLEELRDCDGRESQVSKVLSEMPTSLDTIYDRILNNIRNPDLLSSLGRAMNWLIFSKRPMTLEEIIDALAFDFEKEPLRFNAAERMLPEALLTACAGFVTVSLDATRGMSTIKLAHASVKEYFLSGRRPRGKCEVSEQTGHELIARTCIAYLCSFDHVLDDADLHQYPLALYAAESWAFHATRCDELHLWVYQQQDLRTLRVFFVSYLMWGLFSPLIGLVRMLLVALTAPLQARSMEIARSASAEHIQNGGKLIGPLLQLLQADSPQYMTLSRLSNIDAALQEWSPKPWERSLIVGPSSQSIPPLYLAVRLGIHKLTWELLEKGADVNALGGLYGNALQAASWDGNIEITRLLLDQGADLDARGGRYGNALQAAACRGHIEIVRFLVERGADIEASGGEYGNVLLAAAQGGHHELVCLLLEKGADVNTEGGLYGNALQAAASEGHKEITCLLLERAADVNTHCGRYGNALQAVSHEGHTEIARLLLHCGADVNRSGGPFGNALQAASCTGHIEIVHLLLEQGAEVNAEGGKYGNALVAAAQAGHHEIVCLLLEKEASVNKAWGYYGNALQVASLRGEIDLVSRLLEEGADVNVQGGQYGSALLAASCGGHIEIVQLLLDQGANVSAQVAGLYGDALQAASRAGHTEIARLLLEKGAELNAQGGHYGNALNAAYQRGNIDIVRLLLERGADMHADYYDNALQSAAVSGDIRMVHLLLDQGAGGNARARARNNALLVACCTGHGNIVCLLLEHGADVNAPGGGYANALQAASRGGHGGIVKVLLEHTGEAEITAV